MIICAKFEDPPTNNSSSGVNFVKLKQSRKTSQGESNFSTSFVHGIF